MASGFTVVLRGYDRGQVDAALAEADRLATAGQVEQARRTLEDVRFTVVLRGYDRREVDAAMAARFRA